MNELFETADMADFTEKMHLRGKAEEDIYFAELDRRLIRALREKQASEIPRDRPAIDENKQQNKSCAKN